MTKKRTNTRARKRSTMPAAMAKQAAASKRRMKRWTFTTTDALDAWMEDEYLSEVVLAALSPAPGTQTDTVTFTWWLYGTGGPSRVPYRVVATGVTRWTLTGERTDRAIGFAPGAVRGGVHLAMQVPGTLTLDCAELTVERGTPQKLARPKKPFTDYSYFHVYGPGAPSTAAILSALGAPPAARVTGDAGYRKIEVGEATWVEIYGYPEHTKRGEFHWNVVRKQATDAEWHRALELPHHLGARVVESAWEFVGPPAQWLVAVGRDPSAPAPH